MSDKKLTEIMNMIERYNNHIVKLEFHRLRQIDENRKMSKRLDELEEKLQQLQGSTSHGRDD